MVKHSNTSRSPRNYSDHQIVTMLAPHAGDITGIHLQQPHQVLTALLQRFHQHRAATGGDLDEPA